MPAPKLEKIHKALWGTKDSIQLLCPNHGPVPIFLESNSTVTVDLQVASPEEVAKFTGYF